MSSTSAASLAARQIVLVIGAGPGTGFSVAKRFAQSGHPVGLISRSLSNLQPLVDSINANNPNITPATRAQAFAADATDAASVRSAIAKAASAWGADAQLHGGVFNTTSFFRAPFFDTTEDDVRSMFDGQVMGLLNFGQALIGALKARPGFPAAYPPSEAPSSTAAGFLFVTGASAGMRGSANFGAFAAAKFGVRGLTQSIAREFGPDGIHVAHILVDGIIRTERTLKMIGNGPKNEQDWLNPDDIAETYFALAQQPRNAFTHEIDIRPGTEKW
ncbi:unnamed protein product [Tilletia controversa]|uniref:Oxidoreductase n=3 Tax=Tilletia TaxID=13289 RepID=A0A8X7MNE3_9BASI|nr:hypothetical protein CF336_g6865 [Tilletia laevis]KAE8188898.1 hypothetical protein CF328_g6457 [Tilletia controversa]KAE8252290.1 hypothetical protein A4X03_0g6209 [Tilletia caries]KAE8190857.1 hypothetical protein CF335_g6250 [Tilletia laevis]KAE8242204.1 hypothetical protein A4X06_0g7132 [Tilletia controversa]